MSEETEAEAPELQPRAPVDEPEQEQDNGESSPYAPLAKDMGWTPRDQFQGDPSQWKDAETFIRDGRDIQRETSQRLKSVQNQLDTLAKTSASIVEQTVNERLAALQSKHAEAVDAGDTDEALRLAGQNGKPAPGVNAPGSRTAAPSNRQKGFADMPIEAQNIARDMVDRKVIKDTDAYVRNYFENVKGKA
jgi:hypothetical protein